MQKITLSSTTGKSLCVYLWQGENQSRKTVVQLVHGMAEHMNRYDRFAKALCKAGYIVVGHDHLGHGPAAQKEDLGYFAAQDGWSKVIEDIEIVHQQIKERFPGHKYVLFGHSMGSFAVREYLLRYGDDLAGCIISGTGWFPAPLCVAGKTVAALCGVLGGWHKPAPLVNKIAFGSNNQGFEGRTPFDWLSRDTQEVDRYVADPLCGFLFTARGYYDMFSGLRALARTQRLEAMRKNLPLYFMSGEADPVGGKHAEGVNTVIRQFKNAGVKNITVHIYPEARHELLNETNRDVVSRDVIAWLNMSLK